MHYVFADCFLDTQLYTLSRVGRAIPLRPKAFHVLRYLLEHRDHLVLKEELCAHVWPAQFISDATIEGCIKRARQAIGDTGRTQQLIQTRRGYGYRFVGAVEERLEAFPAQAPTGTLRLAPAAPPQDDTPRRPDPARLPGEDSMASGAGAVSPVPRSSLAPRTTPAAPVQDVPGGERKLVTLLGCTLARATALQARVGLDALHRQMRTLYTLTQEEVHRYGGTLHHVSGTRLLAVFGAPVAQEDHARRVLLAAWGLHQRLAASRRGRALLEEGISSSIRTGDLQGQASRVAWLSEVCRLAGRGEEAGQHARQALDLARQLKERRYEAVALHQLGVVHAHTDPPDVAQAEAYYQQSLFLAEALGMRPLVAHCHHGLGTLYAKTGQQEQARATLSMAIAMYHSMNMTFWLPQAEATLAQVSVC
jgi:DNA-binding winged helix-turn-helix (wHTH) protein/class 3 adenylate cyclase